MKRILILSTGTAIQSHTPNGQDILEISRGLIQRDSQIHIDILSRLEPYRDDNLRIFQIRSRIAHNDAKRHYVYEHFVRNKPLIVSTFGKIISRYLTWKEPRLGYLDKMDFGLLKKWIKKNNKSYDLVISASHPFYLHEYAAYLKKKLGIKKWVSYILDIYSDSCFTKNQSEAIENKKQCFENCDKIFIVDRFIETARVSPVKKYLSKTVPIPYHLITDKTKGQRFEHNDGSIHLVYGGSLIEQIRNPKKLLEVMRYFPDSTILDLYSSGCEDIIQEYATNNIIKHSLIDDAEEYDAILRGANVLISIGNSVDNYVASKVFDYCSYGRPIIHFVNCDEDYTVSKLKDYPLICFIDYREDASTIANKMNEFISQFKDKTVSYDVIGEILSSMTVEHTVQNVLKVLNE